jgi:hypothetical protein
MRVTMVSEQEIRKEDDEEGLRTKKQVVGRGSRAERL